MVSTGLTGIFGNPCNQSFYGLFLRAVAAMNPLAAKPMIVTLATWLMLLLEQVLSLLVML
ncbi:MAG: hypothetical protein CSB28_00145 [Desulfobacterales bacterium]|nr:MAG: hypothetical protein CSB28_00145 [Desulfobacterales bacterium]